MRGAYKILILKPEGNRLLRILEAILKWGINLEGIHWIHLAQDRGQWQVLVSTVMNLWDP
jgi:hypothetical protein